MKKFFIAMAVLLLLCGCEKSVEIPSEISESTQSITAVKEVTEASETTLTTTSVTTFTAIETTSAENAETDAEKMEETTSAAASETTKVSEETTVALTGSLSPEELGDTLEIIWQNSKTVGNDTAGYIYVYAEHTYEEAEDGCFTLDFEDGTHAAVLYYEGIQTNLDQTAYMICLAAALNAEVDGFEYYNISEVVTDGMNGFFAVMVDRDGGAGYKLYMTMVDTDKDIVRALSLESPEYIPENAVAASMAFDSYRRSDD